MEKRQANKFYPYFDAKERPTIDYLVGLFNELLYKRQPILTDFLDPGERQILKTITGHDAFLQSFGGFKGAEKRRVYLRQKPEKVAAAAFQIVAFNIQYPQKFAHLRHSAILGTLANSGLKTSTFGDIITNGQGQWQFFGKKELASYFKQQIDRIGAVKVRLEQLPLSKVLQPVDDSVQKSQVFASLRVDAILAGLSKNSRRQIKQAIAANEVKLNWQELTNSNIIIKENDLLSLRHFGRIKILRIAATRKGKYRVVLKLWQTKGRKWAN